MLVVETIVRIRREPPVWKVAQARAETKSQHGAEGEEHQTSPVELRFLVATVWAVGLVTGWFV